MDQIRHRRHELSVIQIVDPAEESAGAPGEFELVDCEYGGRRKVILDRATAREYAGRFQRYQDDLQAYCRRHQIPLLQGNTRLAVPDLLLRALQKGGFVR
jgi:hypothetical protein